MTCHDGCAIMPHIYVTRCRCEFHRWFSVVLDLPSKWWSVVVKFPHSVDYPPKSGWTNDVYELTSFHFWWKFRRCLNPDVSQTNNNKLLIVTMCVNTKYRLTPPVVISLTDPEMGMVPVARLERWGCFFCQLKPEGFQYWQKISYLSYPVKLGYSCDLFMLFINIIYLCLISSSKCHIFEAVKNSETYPLVN